MSIVFKQTALTLAEQRLISRIVQGLCELRLRLKHDFLEGAQLIDDFGVRGRVFVYAFHRAVSLVSCQLARETQLVRDKTLRHLPFKRLG